MENFPQFPTLPELPVLNLPIVLEDDEDWQGAPAPPVHLACTHCGNWMENDEAMEFHSYRTNEIYIDLCENCWTRYWVYTHRGSFVSDRHMPPKPPGDWK